MRTPHLLGRRSFALAAAAPLLAALVGCDASGGSTEESKAVARKSRIDRLEKAKAAAPPKKKSSRR